MFRAVPSRVRSALAATIALLLSVGPAGAEDKPQETPQRRGGVVTTEEVTVLTLDVLALDKKGRPVFGLQGHRKRAGPTRRSGSPARRRPSS